MISGRAKVFVSRAVCCRLQPLAGNYIEIVYLRRRKKNFRVNVVFETCHKDVNLTEVTSSSRYNLGGVNCASSD